jgi:hypothetical protein
MAKDIGQNINITDIANVPVAFSIDSTTAVNIAEIRSEPIFSLTISNRGDYDLFVRLYDESQDNLKRGFTINSGDSVETLNFARNYTGAVSAIFESGTAKDVMVTII